MGTLKYSSLVVLVVVAVGVGCARRAPVGQTQIQRVAPIEVGWGPAAEGLQCRLRPTRRVVAAGENPAFRIDLCNRGGRVFAFLCGEQAPVHQVSIDGRWRRWPERPPTDGKIRALGPGVEVADLPVILSADTQPSLSPGRHIVQFAFSFEGVDVVSNPVEIEIVESR